MYLISIDTPSYELTFSDVNESDGAIGGTNTGAIPKVPKQDERPIIEENPVGEGGFSQDLNMYAQFETNQEYFKINCQFF